MIRKAKIKYTESGHPIVPVTINGESTNLIIDTGSDVTCLDSSKSAEFKIEMVEDEESETIGACGKKIENNRSADSVLLKIGGGHAPFTTTMREVNLMDMTDIIPHISEKESIGGIIGMDFIRSKCIIDFHKGILTIK